MKHTQDFMVVANTEKKVPEDVRIRGRSRQMRIVCLAVLILGCVVDSFAQGVNLRGTILQASSTEGESTGLRDNVDYVPLPGAYVRWSSAADQIEISDVFGFFKITSSYIGDTLVVSMLGYETVGLVYAGQKFVEIPLESGVYLESAEVTGTRKSVNLNLLDPVNIQSLNRKELVKAACCNLSEAFETNASVDASFTDAVTGTRQIRMLGLDGKYSQIQVDNLTGPRGLNVIQGLMFIPGDWIHEIHISKGAGTVTQGHESMTGQINVALKNVETADPLHVNLYANGAGRLEWNHVSRHKMSRRWSTAILTHALRNNQLNDRNRDGFLDSPLKRHYIGRNEFKFIGDRGVRGEYAVNWIHSRVAAGQRTAYGDNLPWSDVMSMLEGPSEKGWSAITAIDRIELSAKTGFVFPDAEWRSIGLQVVFSDHHNQHRFGDQTYRGKERFFRGNVLYSGILGNTNRSFTTGMSFVTDRFDERVSNLDTLREHRARHEMTPGAFFELNLKLADRFNIIMGARYDQHNLFGGFWSPRVHSRWSVTENTSIKLSAGRGFRTANPFMEQLGSWASQRTWHWDAYGNFQPEIATNMGLNLTSKFRLNYRDASFAFDVYNTWFENKVVVDLDRNAQQIRLYNLEGESFARSAQVEFNWDMHRRLDLRVAYRWVEAHTDRTIGLPSQDPFVSKHRAFTQLSWASRQTEKSSQWLADATLQWMGSQRLPRTNSNPEGFNRPDMAPGFVQLNVQITRQFSETFSVYGGVENALNYRQERPIIGADYGGETITSSDFNQYFDASLVYGPIFGRMVYAGLRWNILPSD
ncbi:MAG TPA: hypothetical protein DCF87_06985 [Opitutae bacterium]|nr:hypothetical protein [Opitutae bacterium]